MKSPQSLCAPMINQSSLVLMVILKFHSSRHEYVGKASMHLARYLFFTVFYSLHLQAGGNL